ncbi:hypothetical protein LRR80_04615 [Streptomyces sp. RO-S4]|uniref:KAP family P-loop NTPase fold protein n=1 Tax=Streptomyces sp. RO-S4 TaxID=2902486 RepID=UPI00208F76FC|nr:P-loop NTPase fold protein [Streptomyces sp. RO-S4]MCO4698535.1 hypothetical protein [Streptomyces sp. RO-S4]
MSQRTYFRDAPDPENDALEHAQFAERTVRAIQEIRRQSESSVAGLIAPWGAGKSTALTMIVNGLKEHASIPWTVVELNPWLYSDVESLQIGFFVALREALPRGRKWKKGRERIGNFFVAISPAGKVNGLVGVDASSALEAFGQKVAGDTSANALREKAESSLKDLEQPILFVMDDLDRLTPDELLMVFKLVRLVGRLPNVYYLLAYDEKTLLDLIQQTDVASGDRARARDYMEKIIQVRLDLPSMRPQQQEELINAAMTEIMERYDIVPDAEDLQLFSGAFIRYMKNVLTTPRSIKRYFAQVDALYETLNKEVNFIEFALITFIRTFEPDAYKKITGAWRSEITGDTSSLLRSNKENAEQKTERWHGLLTDAHVDPSHVPGLYGLLVSLFPRLGANGVSSTQRDALARRRSVGDRDYFERYFTFGVPGDDISDETLSALIRRIDQGADAEALETVTNALRNSTCKTCRKVDRALPGNQNAASRLLPHLADIYADAPHEFFSVNGSPMLHLQSTAELALAELNPQDIERTINTMNELSHGALLASIAVQTIRENQELPQTEMLVQHVARVLESRVRGIITTDLASVSTHEFRHVYHWRMVAGKENTDATLRNALTEGPWTALDFAARNISVATTGGAEYLSELPYEILDEVIGIEYFFHELQDEIDQVDAPIMRHHYSDTIDNRRLLALSFLRSRRESTPRPEGA